MEPSGDIYTDGSCLGNPGRGGWAFYVVAEQRLVSGSEPRSTNNRMELMAVIRALESITTATQTVVYTDSTYVKRGITTWIRAWKRNGWLTARGQPVKNADLWRRLDDANARMQSHVTFRWVRAHASSRYNNLVDRAAREAAIHQTPTLVSLG